MKKTAPITQQSHLQWLLGLSVLCWTFSAPANPIGGTVNQGKATFTSQGSQFTINQTTPGAYINWQSFNIGLGETTTFNQLSSSSVVWNHINDPNASQILGNLNANGYVILQNQNGFFIGGQAVINTHGLLMITAPIPMPDLSTGGPWDIKAPPPTASIINLGQISTDKGGSVFLIAHDIQNQGTISAPAGNIGLYAGQEVLVSDRPDGRGLSARVTLPSGSVDNSGKLIADAGTIALNAQVVNQGGVIQANSVREVNGAIELVASDSLNIGANSTISAQGDSQGTSPGGMVVLHSGNSYADTPTSTISVSGGAAGGRDGLVEIFGHGTSLSTVQSRIDGLTASQFAAQDILLVNPSDITLSTDPTDTSSANPNFNLGDLSSYTKIALFAEDNITLNNPWTLPNSQDPIASIKLSAGNNITLLDGSRLAGGNNWSVEMLAGTALASGSQPKPGSDGIYLQGGSSIATQDGNIDLWAANEVIIDPTLNLDNGVRTLAGGSIQVTAQLGDVNTGGNVTGYQFQNTAPYYTVLSLLGGISTAAGGDVDISAGGDVRSYLPRSNNGDPGQDGGTGAFGAGNVSIHAGGNVFGHFVLANGTGTITAGGNVGGQASPDNLALSLIKGSWTVNAPNGSIFLQEVRNPNGTYNNTTRPRGSTGPNPNHLFDYDPHASVTLNAGDSVQLLTSPANLPRGDVLVPALFAPSLYISAGNGGIYLADQVTLFPSAFGNLELATTGGGGLFASTVNGGNGAVQLLMSDSGAQNYRSVGAGSFTALDHGSGPLEINSPDPVILNISGSMQNINLITVKETQITVGGDLINCAFSGQNLHGTDKTTIDVKGQILNSPSFSSVILQQSPTFVGIQDLPPNLPNRFDTLLVLAVDPSLIAQTIIPANTPRSLVINYWGNTLIFGRVATLATGTGFAYDAATRLLSFQGHMTADLLRVLQESTITVVRFASDGFPMVDASGHLVTDTYSWANRTDVNTIINKSATTSFFVNQGLRIGGPGEFDVHAGSISLGDSYGILSCGALDYGEGGYGRYTDLAGVTPVGAILSVKADENISLLTSTIAALAGGNVEVKSSGGEIDLGSAGVLFTTRLLPLGAFITGPGDISVSAYGNVNIDGSRIAAYDGGNVTVHSDTGNVDAGSGGTTAALVETHFVDPTGQPGYYRGGVYGSGILAVTLANPDKIPGGAPLVPGNIEVTTPQGNIYASLGGILQEALNGSIAAGPTVTLTAGTPPNGADPGYKGNIDLGESGVIGGTINLTANGNINGLVISRQNSTVNAAQNFTGAVLAGGAANVSATAGSVSGTIVGVGGASVSGGAGVTAQVLSQNASVNGASATSTLGTSAAASSTTQAAAAQTSTDSKENVLADASQDDSKKKNKGTLPALTRKTGRVTVILPPSS
jgi:filamentous hemagglutinin family protein